MVHQVSRGVRAGTISDMDAAEQAIGYAVNSAEQMAGEQIREVVVNLAGGHPASQIVGVEMSITGHDVGEVDLKRALKAHNNAAVSPDREVIHAIDRKSTRLNSSH